MNSVVISGYYGFKNAGDEAILMAVISQLRKKDSNIKITVLSGDPVYTKNTYGVDAVNRASFPDVYRAIKNSTLFISGGGSLLQDVTSNRSLIYYLGVIKLAQLLKKPVVIYGQGIGPITKKRNRWLATQILNSVSTITVRDRASKIYLLDMGVKNKDIHITADPVLAMERIDISIGRDILTSSGIDMNSNKPLIGVATRPWQNSNDFSNILSSALDSLINDLGARVVFIPFHREEDVAESRKIAERMKGKVVVLGDDCSVEELISVIGNLDLLIGVRLHSLIFAALMDVPLLGISYDPKIDGFLKSIGQNSIGHVNDIDLGDLIMGLQKGWNKRNLIKTETFQAMVNLKTNADSNVDVAIVKYLKENDTNGK